MTTLTFVPAPRERFSTRQLIRWAFWPGVLFLVEGVGLLNPREGLRIWNEARILLS
jgi:hypothetical protein